MPILTFNLICRGPARPVTARIETLVIAGWTGRDVQKVELHIRELEAIGVPRPVATPLFYRLSSHLLTLEDQVQVLGTDCTGEAEVVLIQSGGELFVGVGSDLTDRRVERVGVALAKQVCAKPLGAQVWPLAEIADHWDALILRSVLLDGEKRTVYQEGSVTELLAPTELAARFSRGCALAEGTVLFCGTLPVQGALRSGTGFQIELIDPVLHRVLRHAYRITEFAIVG